MKYFNALKSFDQLKAAGVSEEQARAMIGMVQDSLDSSMANIATKTDIAEIKLEVKAETGALRIDLEKLIVSVGWMQKLFFASTFLILVDVMRGFITSLL